MSLECKMCLEKGHLPKMSTVLCKYYKYNNITHHSLLSVNLTHVVIRIIKGLP